jgi:hypothetical protein
MENNSPNLNNEDAEAKITTRTSSHTDDCLLIVIATIFLNVNLNTSPSVTVAVAPAPAPAPAGSEEELTLNSTLELGMRSMEARDDQRAIATRSIGRRDLKATPIRQ